jgi:hypothetical protein
MAMDVTVDETRHHGAVGRIDDKRVRRGIHSGRTDRRDGVAIDDNVCRGGRPV